MCLKENKYEADLDTTEKINDFKINISVDEINKVIKLYFESNFIFKNLYYILAKLNQFLSLVRTKSSKHDISKYLTTYSRCSIGLEGFGTGKRKDM